MDSGEEQPPKRYYYVLGLSQNASACAIRSAYRKLAMKWHPDKCSGQDQAEAKVKFQEIQEAYAVLSDERKKMLYDNGLYNPDDDDDDIEGLSNFISEMSGMMTDVQASEEAGKGNSFEELQQLFVSMFSADLAAFNDPSLLLQPPTLTRSKVGEAAYTMFPPSSSPTLSTARHPKLTSSSMMPSTMAAVYTRVPPREQRARCMGIK